MEQQRIYWLWTHAMILTGFLVAVASAQPAGPGATAPATAGDLKVWVLNGLERVLRDDPAGSRTSIALYVARNEWESCQIALRSSKFVRINDLTPEFFTHPSGAFLTVDNFRIYREHQLHLEHASRRNENFRAGWYPDPLIPFHHPLTFQRLTDGRFSAVPFNLPPDETHAFWIDFYIPEDTMPGRYKGAFNVLIEGQNPVRVPIEIEVWDFALPKQAAMYTQFGSPADRISRYYEQLIRKGEIEEEPDYEAIRAECATVVSAHRLNCDLPSEVLSQKVGEDGSFELTDEQIAEIERWNTFYQVNCVPLPRPQGKFRDPVKEADRLANWLKSWDRALETAGLGDRLRYIYLLDEPNDAEAYETVRQWGTAIRDAATSVKVLVTEQTSPQKEEWGSLYGAVDIWVPLFPLFEPESAEKRQAEGEQVWTYTALCQGGKPTPWWQIDFPIAHYRSPAWIAWRHEMKGLLYWGGLTFWYHVDDPWTNPLTYQPGDRSLPIEKRAVYNGEGVLAYPAHDVGFEGIVPSMRLKVLRDALEDFDYLAILEEQGKRDAALEVTDGVAKSWYDWTNDPEAYFAARQALAKLILGDAYPEPKPPSEQAPEEPGEGKPGKTDLVLFSGDRPW